MRELWQGKSSTPVLEVRNLSRHGEYLNINLRVEAGEVVSIVGLLGAGRTELCLSLFGMTRPDAGEILINGQPVTLHSNRGRYPPRYWLCFGRSHVARFGDGAIY